MMMKRFKYSTVDLTHKLSIDEVEFNDAGEYIFQAGTQKATAYLYVQPPEAPKFVQELRNCIVIAGDTAKFTVRATGRPAPEVTWYKEGITVTPSFKYKILNDEDQYTLAVVEVEATDAGEYTCEATNENGTFRTTATLQVDNKAEMPEPSAPIASAPAIVEPMQDFITREGQSARFQCKVVGTNIKVIWSRDGKRIKPSRYFKMSEFNGVHQLEVTEAYPEDEGVYKITVSSDQGEVSCSATLKLDIDPPRVIEPLQPAHVIEGSAVKMDCVIEGEQLVVRWFNKGHDVTDNPQYKCKWEEASGHCWMIIMDCKKKDTGEIRCHVSNFAGEAVCSTDLLVTGKSDLDENRKQYLSQIEMQLSEKQKEYEISFPVEDVKTEFSPMIAEPAESTMAKEGNDAKFQVRLASLPEPEVAWYKDGKIIGPSGFPGNKFQFYYESRAHSHTRGVVVSGVRPEDAGKYELKAWNKLGQVACAATLKVQGMGRRRN
uniref:Ig-like domain-containing protein n=1 Tax=Ciona savignyi TaxID=51511 RepID=H2YNK3_CIOSA